MRSILLSIGAVWLLSGCAILYPGYLETKPEISNLQTTKSSEKDVLKLLDEPAVTFMDMGKKTTYKYYYKTPEAIIDKSLLLKGSYGDGCKKCGELLIVFDWDKKFARQGLLRGISMIDSQKIQDLEKLQEYLNEKQFVNAFELATLLANENVTRAQHVLGLLYVNGDGVKKDFEQARYWFERASFVDDPSATYDLGAMYRNGEGVVKDLNKAIELYKKAGNLGHLQAINELLKIYVELGISSEIEYWTKKYNQVLKK